MSAEIWNEAYDLETGMANLPAFLEHVGHAMRRLRRSPLTMAVLTASAHELVRPGAGRSEPQRTLLIATARRIRRSIRPGDVAARIADATFAVLCEDLRSYDHAVGVAVRLLDDLDRPFLVDGEQVRVRLRFGVAFPLADEGAARPLLDRSVEALRAARLNPTARYDVILGSAAPDTDRGDASSRSASSARDDRADVDGPDERAGSTDPIDPTQGIDRSHRTTPPRADDDEAAG